ncbi:MAG: hypothetical protein Q8M08_12080 [Bacteroidales bacterium]|nr:hypothetical protein [Bacteroidales bacterium]
MPRRSYPHILIISGSGKKVGKTYMATALIRSFSIKFPLIALKISPHFHDSLGNTRLIAVSEGTRIFQDLGPHHKNSGQFLEAGAFQSYFMETDDRHLTTAFDIFMNECNPSNHPVICESGALSSLIKPGILIFITHSSLDLQEPKLSAMNRADLIIPARSFSPAKIIDRISFLENRWRRQPG